MSRFRCSSRRSRRHFSFTLRIFPKISFSVRGGPKAGPHSPPVKIRQKRCQKPSSPHFEIFAFAFFAELFASFASRAWFAEDANNSPSGKMPLREERLIEANIAACSRRAGGRQRTGAGEI